MGSRTLRGAVAVAGAGESTYYKRGRSPDPEFVMCCESILNACTDAGLDPREIDGFSAYADERSDPTRLAAALGVNGLRYSNMVFGGGGAMGSAAVANAAMAIATGMAETVVVYRSLAQGQFRRFGAGAQTPTISGPAALTAPYGLTSAAQQFALRVMRLFHERGVSPSTQKALALASYHHAQQNPRAVMYGRPLGPDDYDNSRWIAEPFHLFDCCMENDGAAAIVIVSAERAKDLRHAARPCYLLGAAAGNGFREGTTVHNAEPYASAGFTTLVPRLYEMAGVAPSDVDVVQGYVNFTGGVVMGLVEHGLCTYDDVNEACTFENLISPTGRMPFNTSGGNLAECYVHGLELQLEGVRQVWGESCNQVPDAKVSLVFSGPMVAPTSDCIYGSEETL